MHCNHKNQTHFVYVASFFADVEDPITIYRWHSGEGKLSKIGSTGEGSVNPFALAVDPGKRYLYSADSLVGMSSPDSGAVCAHAIDGRSGALTYLGQQPCGGKIPVYISLSSDGRFVFTASHDGFDDPPKGGIIRAFPVGPAGSIEAFYAERQHEGSSSMIPQQEAAHPHAILLDTEDRWLFVPDLGTDRIEIYGFEADSGRISDEPVAGVSVRSGSGPRHFRIHPNGHRGYLINQFANTIVGFAFDPDKPALVPLQSISTLPAEVEDQSGGCADLLIHPSGRFLYGTNRGHDSIAIFRIDIDSGRLSLIDNKSTRGSMPQGICFDPTARYLLVSNSGSDTLAVFGLDPESGLLSDHGDLVTVPSPVWITIVSLTG